MVVGIRFFRSSLVKVCSCLRSLQHSDMMIKADMMPCLEFLFLIVFFLAVYFPSCPVRHFLTLFWKVLQKPLCLTTFLTVHRSGGNCFLHHNCRHQVPVQTEYLLCSGPGLRSLQALCQVSVTYLFPEIILDCFCVCVYPTVKIWDSVLLLLKMFLCFKTAGVNLMRRR